MKTSPRRKTPSAPRTSCTNTRNNRWTATAPALWRRGHRQASRSGPVRYDRGSDVEVGDAQRIVLDEFAPRLHDVAHQLDENVVGFDGFLDANLQQRAHFAVERRLPELLGIHLAETLVALHLADAFLARRHD